MELATVSHTASSLGWSNLIPPRSDTAPRKRITEKRKFHKQTYQLWGYLSSEYEIIIPLTVTLECDDGLFVVCDEVFFVYGDGESAKEAMTDYETSLVEFYQLVKARAGEDIHDQRLLEYLQFYLRRRNT